MIESLPLIMTKGECKKVGLEPPAGEFNFEEENAVCYVGGYVIVTLKKKYQSDCSRIESING